MQFFFSACALASLLEAALHCRWRARGGGATAEAAAEDATEQEKKVVAPAESFTTSK